MWGNAATIVQLEYDAEDIPSFQASKNVDADVRARKNTSTHKYILCVHAYA